MSEVVKWDGFPEEYRGNTGAHYLLKLATGEEIRADYCPYDEEWSGPGFMLSRKNTAKYYSYLRPFTVVLSVEEMEAQEALKKQAIAEAVAAERERCAKVCEGLASGTFPDLQNLTDAGHRTIAWDACCEELAEAIRSTPE